MSYTTIRSSEDTFDVLEKDTDIVIELKRDEKSIREICRKLNLGSGFEGFTPPFFAEKFEFTT
jgi:hypothetical protein